MTTPGAAASAAPSWAETSVRWLRANYPQYVPVVSKKTFPEQLNRALHRMCLDKVEFARAKKGASEYEAHITALITGWDGVVHERMKAFLAAGGYEHELELEDARLAAERQRQREELIAREMAADEDNHVALAPGEATAGADLEEVLLAVEREENPDLGTW